MLPRIDALEGRQLLSATSGLGSHTIQLLADARVTRSAIVAGVSGVLADLRAVNADLRGLPNNPQNQKLIATLRNDAVSLRARVQSDVGKVVTAALPSAHRLISDVIAVFTHPTNANFATRLINDLSALSDAANAPVDTLVSDAQAGGTQLASDLNALAAANSSNSALQSDVQKTQTDAQNAISQATGDIQTLESDFGGLIQTLTGL